MVNTVRDGKKVWPYCIDCGCRLKINLEDNLPILLEHFGLDDSKDARGCICNSIIKMWEVSYIDIEHLYQSVV